MTRDNDSITSKLLWFSLRTLINMMLLFVLVEGCIMAYQFSYELFADYPYIAASESVMKVNIDEGSAAVTVAGQLEQAGIVKNKYLFLARVYLGKYNNRIQAGTYTLGPGMTPDEICRKLCGVGSGDST